MKILLRFTSTCLVLFFLFACGKEPGQKSGEIDYSGYGRLLTGRTNHTAVWTGSKMIVFGGFTKSTVYVQPGQFSGDFSTPNDVISYDPAADQWSSIKTVGTSISGHSAVWTGSEMIVWGGVTTDPTNIVNVTNSGTRYNPSTTIWSGISATHAPSPRQGHTAIWAQPVSGQTGTSVMIVWGGTSDPSILNSLSYNLSNILNNGGLYDPAHDTWSTLQTANAPTVTSYASVWTGQVMIIWGGVAQSNNSVIDVNTGARYNPASNVWSTMSTTNAPIARYSPVAVWTGSRMIIFGGARFGQNNGPSIPLGDGAAYDPATDTWTSIADFPNFTAGSNNIDFNGFQKGFWTGSELLVWMNSKYEGRYDPTTNTWRTPALTESPNWVGLNISSTTLWDGTEMINWGGWSNNNSNNGNLSNASVSNTGFKYNPTTDTTSRTSIFIK